jgi:hypothetical protein
MEAPQENNDYLSVHARQLIESYRRWTGHDLVDSKLSPVEQARALYEAPFVMASHGTEADPVFNYANRAALTLFETTWTDFTSMPSRLSRARSERNCWRELTSAASSTTTAAYAFPPAAAVSASDAPRYGTWSMRAARRAGRR